MSIVSKGTPIASYTLHVRTPAIVMIMAGGAGLSVASIYYSQPMLGILGADMQAGADTIGLVPTLTQMGYALGILFLAPLGIARIAGGLYWPKAHYLPWRYF